MHTSRPNSFDENQSKIKPFENSEKITKQESSDSLRICNSGNSNSELLRNTHEELKIPQMLTGSNSVSQNQGLHKSEFPQLTNSLNPINQIESQINEEAKGLDPGNSLISVGQDCNVITHGFECQRSVSDIVSPEQILV